MLRGTLSLVAAMLIAMATCSLDADPVFQVRVTGRITDPYHCAIENALVAVTYMASTSSSTETRTGGDGTFTIELATIQGTSLRIVSQGFKVRQFPVPVSQSNVIDLGEITLEVISLGGPDVEVVAQKYMGRYSDPSYGFSVAIPEGLEGWTFASHTPDLQDARAVSIKAGSQSTVFVEAAYELLGDGSQLKANSRIGGLHASERIWKESDGARISHKSVVARRAHHDRTIRYKIQVDYGPDEEAVALRIFRKVMNSFRTAPIAK
jgi:hypothetical protein